MSNQSRVVKALAKFKMDVYANQTSKQEMKKFLIERLQLQVWSGQKRLVVFDPENPKVVYKIAYSDQGISDNIFEVAWSNKLRLLQQAGQISMDDLQLFGLATMIDGDPFIIQMEAATNYIQDPDFISWYKANRHNFPDFNENQVFAKYVSSDPGLCADHNTIAAILARFSKPSDVTIFKEPKNYCLRRDNSGRKRLILIDMGSVCPNLLRNGQPVPAVCSKCGHELIYVPYKLDPGIDPGKAQEIDGKYGCRNPECPDFLGNALNTVLTPATKDTYVFSQYLFDNRDLVRNLKAVDGAYFMPNRRIIEVGDYYQEVKRSTGWNPNTIQVNIMFRNYASKVCGDLYAANAQDIKNIPAVQGNRLVSFQQYLSMFNNTLQRVGEQIDRMTTRVAALTYVSILTSRDSDLTAFDVLTQPDFNQFAALISQRYHIDEVNGRALFNALQLV